MATTRLNQIIAIEADVRAKAQQTQDMATQVLANPTILTGHARRYKPRDEAGTVYPDETKLVQLTVAKVLERLALDLGRLWDVVATKDNTNTGAKADVVVDGQTLLSDVPSTHLVWLEKRLGELRKTLLLLPVLDPGEEWAYDDTIAMYRSSPSRSVRNRRVPKPLVKYDATKEHPAQVEVYNVEEPEGDWTTTQFSGAIPEERRRELLDRLDALKEAVKVAREEANGQPVTDLKVGAVLFGYLLAP